jgi:hypothetical protein
MDEGCERRLFAVFLGFFEVGSLAAEMHRSLASPIFSLL